MDQCLANYRRYQKVIIEGESSRDIEVYSGVPQGTVLGPLMFLIYINDIASYMTSTCRLFADDCIIYRSIESKNDCICLQNDLDHFSQWNNLWQMKVNITKCAVIHCSRSRSSTLQYTYNINHQPLNVTDQHPYLGVTIHKSMSWASHINTIVLKASRTLNFIKRNLYRCSKKVKETAYLTLVRPCLEYASSVWDPYQLYLISNIKKIQRRAARWTLSDYNRYSSVSNMLKQLQWSSLEKRWSDSRLCMLYRILHDPNTPIEIPHYIIPTQYPTRNNHPYHYILPYAFTT